MKSKTNNINFNLNIWQILDQTLTRCSANNLKVFLALNIITRTMITIRKVLRKENTFVISIPMFHENINNMIFKVLSSVVYFIIKHYLCADHLCSSKTKLHIANKSFENTTCSDISIIRISGLLMNIIPFHLFGDNTKSSVIFSCSICLVIFQKNVLLFLKKIQVPWKMCLQIWNEWLIKNTYIYILYFIMVCYRYISSEEINFKASQFVLFFTGTFYQSTTKIKKMILY